MTGAATKAVKKPLASRLLFWENLSKAHNTHKCCSCKRVVYATEELQCLQRVWHRQCFQCCKCQTRLSLRNFQEVDKKVFCAKCYRHHLSGASSAAIPSVIDDLTTLCKDMSEILERKRPPSLCRWESSPHSLSELEDAPSDVDAPVGESCSESSRINTKSLTGHVPKALSKVSSNEERTRCNSEAPQSTNTRLSRSNLEKCSENESTLRKIKIDPSRKLQRSLSEYADGDWSKDILPSSLLDTPSRRNTIKQRPSTAVFESVMRFREQQKRQARPKTTQIVIDTTVKQSSQDVNIALPQKGDLKTFATELDLSKTTKPSVENNQYFLTSERCNIPEEKPHLVQEKPETQTELRISAHNLTQECSSENPEDIPLPSSRDELNAQKQAQSKGDISGKQTEPRVAGIHSVDLKFEKLYNSDKTVESIVASHCQVVNQQSTQQSSCAAPVLGALKNVSTIAEGPKDLPVSLPDLLQCKGNLSSSASVATLPGSPVLPDVVSTLESITENVLADIKDISSEQAQFLNFLSNSDS